MGVIIDTNSFSINQENTLTEESLDNAKETIEQYYKDENALFYVTIKDGNERKAVDKIYDIVGDKGGITGTAVDQASSQSMALK